MKEKGTSYWLSLVGLLLILGIAGMFLATSPARGAMPLLAPGEPPPDPPPPPGTVLSAQDVPLRGALSLTAPGDVIEVFTNTWAYSTIGLVYAPGRDSVRYAHESQSSTHNPTIYDVDYAIAHSVIYSFALSTVNSGWPWQIDNRDGAGYDFVHDTYFLPDYNGDLSYADDNIVEVDPDGIILNAWEMDDEVGSNDSSDGSEIDKIIDIAVVPGSPPRYFVAAAYDGNVVYEIALTRTGTWWTPNTWRTVATYTVPLLPLLDDNLGIDWDAEHEVLFHSSWDTTTIVITDLGMNPIAGFPSTFDCPGAGGYNSGVTYIEGSDPSEVWVTDFSSDKTTRCQTPFAPETPVPAWTKRVDGRPWDPSIPLPVETGQPFHVTDVITAVQPFTLTENWDPLHLELVDVEVVPPVGTVVVDPGSIQVVVPPGPPEVVTVFKTFRVLPCNWPETVLEEVLAVEGGPPFDPRPVRIVKELPELHLAADYDPEVYAGNFASFQLVYSNTGGFENDVSIRNSFPISAPFVFADPLPDEVGPGGAWVRWDIGNLARGDRDTIDVWVLISETVPTSNTVVIWDGIFDHIDNQWEDVLIEFHVDQPPFLVDWVKFVDGVEWGPGMAVTLQTSQTLTVEDTLILLGPNDAGYGLLEEWNPDQLELVGWEVFPPEYLPFVAPPAPGLWVLEVPPGFVFPDPVTIVKQFHVRPSNWPETVLWEQVHYGLAFRSRPVVVRKDQPDLWIDSFFDVAVYSGDEAEFELRYGNVGGFESNAMIRNEFPPQAPFDDSFPPPTSQAADGSWAEWDLGALATGDQGSIDVTVRIGPNLPPSTTIEIWDGILDHAGVLDDETFITFHVPPPTWDKWVNDVPWTPDLAVGVQTSDTITVTDVISTRSAVAIVEHWNPERLRLDRFELDPPPPAGVVDLKPGFLAWEFPQGPPGPITITKFYHVEPCTWTYTVLWEELWVEGVEWERRPVHIEKMPADLWIDSIYEPDVFSGREATFTLLYGNFGGFESRAWIRNVFPPEARFAGSVPPPSASDPNGLWAVWELGPLAHGQEDQILVTVDIAPGLPPFTFIDIYDRIYDHVDVERGVTQITFRRGPAIYLPLVLRNFTP